MLDNFLTDIRKPHGLVLVAGPTSRQNYNTLRSIKKYFWFGTRHYDNWRSNRNSLPGISQTQVNNKIGLNFAEGLKAILWQDVIMVVKQR